MPLIPRRHKRHANRSALSSDSLYTDDLLPAVQMLNDNDHAVAEVFARRMMVDDSSFVKDHSADPALFCESRRHDREAFDPRPLYNGEFPGTAVCLVGTPRTMLRPDVLFGLRSRLLAGWGGGRSTKVFAVLADSTPAGAEEGQPPRDGVMRALQENLGAVSTEWYGESSTKNAKTAAVCSDNHEVKALKQHKTCLNAIREFERRAYSQFRPPPPGVKRPQEWWLFDVVIRVRPDDLWFGPILPFCVMNSAAPRVASVTFATTPPA